MIKVLAVDDDFNMTELLKGMLKKPDFEVHSVNSGTEAIQALREIDPDIILLDMMMPDMSGWQVSRAIREFSEVPILALTAVIHTEGVMQSLEAGVNDYLLKPVPKGVLIANIKKLVKPKEA